MTDITENSSGTEAPPLQPRVTRRDLVEGNVEKAVTDHMSKVAVGARGGIDYSNLRDMIDAAKALSAAGPMLRPWLQGNVGGCFGIIMKAQELGMTPLQLQAWTYIVEQWIDGQKVQQIAYESQFFHAIVEAHAPITTRLQFRYEGKGEDILCRVFATFKGEAEPRYWPPLDADPANWTLKALHPGHTEKNGIKRVKGSPLWDDKPELQLFYNMSRDWARAYAPDIVAGMFSRDEMEDVGYTAVSEVAKDVSPKLLDRLRIARSDEGFVGEQTIQSIDSQLAAAKAAEPVKKPKKETEPLATGQEGEAGSN